MFKSKLSKVIVSLLRRIAGVTRSGAKRLMRAMLQALMAMGRRARLPVAGFVLPTVTMVLLVVILLTVAIVFRSFDRANTARNVRVNQQVLAAATPALDRAKAKINELLDPQNRESLTPDDQQLYRVMSSYTTGSDRYTFGDETRLKLSYPLNGSTITKADKPQDPLLTKNGTTIIENEAINTAWRYPVDTNNDGLFDTFTLYGIFFRRPPLDPDPTKNGDFYRARKPLDARTPPMSLSGLGKPLCPQGSGTSASLGGTSGWEPMDGKLKKSFFVYTVNVPMTATEAATVTGADPKGFTGTSSISALEYQQDQSLIPLSNNAVVYEDDLDISPGPDLNLNGRVFTNSNLLISGTIKPESIKLFQVSSKNSCFYEQENSKIVVAGNVVNGWAGNTSVVNSVVVHLFKTTTDTNQPNTSAPLINAATQSVKGNSLQVLYNNDAYSNRLTKVVEGQSLIDQSNDPPSVKQAQNPPLRQTRDQALEDYFKQRLRKVPFAEAPPGNKGLDITQPATSFVEGSGDTLRAKIIDGKDWNLPTGTAILGATSGSTNLTLVPAQPPAQLPEKVKSGSEENLGDRLIVGNNLPAQRWNGTKFIKATDEPQKVDGTTTWQGSGELRTRKPQVTKLAEVGAIKRGNGLGEKPDPSNPFKDGFWEKAAAEIPQNPLSGIGGLRVITSAGVYDRTTSFLPPPKWIGISTAGVPSLQNAASLNTYDDPSTGITETFPVVWPDTMPMSPLGVGSTVFNNQIPGVNNWIDFPAGTLPSGARSTIDPNTPQYAKGDLRMRATAVYHYAKSGYNPDSLAATAQPNQEPFACVSSYYDPSSAVTARNVSPLADVSGQGADAPEDLPTLGGTSQPTVLGSNNGITYTAPTRAVPGISAPSPTTGLLGGGDATFETQANFVFPDGRFANGPLRTALQVAPTDRTLAQQAAVDSTWCALKILDNTIAPDPALIPHGAIQEVAFLNGREIKAVDRDDPATAVNEAFTLSSPLGTVAPAAQLTGNYNQPLEEREPLEIRATQLDIKALRGQDIAGPNAAADWLLPNSGIIYASRDDALPDRSARSTKPLNDEKISPTDNLLDPARKPNGIVLINGQYLFRGKTDIPAVVTSVPDVVREKGLILVSNLPAYIKGTFNPHGNNPPVTPPAIATFKKVEEFVETVDMTLPDPSPTFYARSKLNPDFACRKGDPRLTGCGGDFWRPATVLADAVSLISQNYRFGFRNEGDFDLRNNAGAAAVLPRRQQGFFNNNFVTNGLSSGAFSNNGNLFTGTGTRLTDATYVAIPPTTMPLRSSSYFNNFVTPVQRRGPLPEYVMEVCTKLPVSECGEGDWFIDPLATTPRTAIAGGTPVTPYEPPNPTLTTLSFQAGSTVDPPVPELQRFPRRVAFNRTVSPPTPLGINGTTVGATAAVNSRPLRDNSLWFAATTGSATITYDATNPLYLVNGTVLPSNTTIRDGSSTLLPDLATPSSLNPLPTVPPTAYSGSQPLLLPVLQIQTATADAPQPALPKGVGIAKDTGWLPQAVETTFNLIVGAGDTPSRALNTSFGDFNGGLQNLPRFLESWNEGVIATNIQGSFIQQTRSAFSTAPYQPILPVTSPPQAEPTTKLLSLFAQSPTTPLNIPEPLYRTEGARRFPYFSAPKRNWGFDVGILSQAPDLFAQKFTTPSTTPPAEYFREVGRDDEWIKTLMCGVLENGGTNATVSSRPTGCP